MLATAGRALGLAVVLTALVLAPAIGYANTHVLLIFGAVAAVLTVLGRSVESGTAPSTSLRLVPLPRSAGEDPVGAVPTQENRQSSEDERVLHREAGEGDQRSWWRGRPRTQTLTTLLFAIAFALILIAALGAMRQPADLLALVPYLAPLCFLPFASVIGDRAPNLARLALIGAGIGLVSALALRYGIGRPRAGEGSFITDPYRLAVTTLLCATLALGALFTRERWRWLSLLGLVAAAGVIWLTGSRTALLGVPAVLLITALCFVRKPVAIAGLLLGTAALGAVALFVELPGRSRMRLWDVLGGIARGDSVADESIWVRIRLWSEALRDIPNAPIFGHGWGDWLMAPLRDRFPSDLESLHTIQHMHNDALHYAMAGGVLGIAAWLLLLAAPLAGYVALPREQRTRQRLHAILVLVGGYFVLGLADIMLASPAQLTLYVALTAVVLSPSKSSVR
jgi:O-antigen ligase